MDDHNTFFIFLKHFIVHVNYTSEKKLLLIQVFCGSHNGVWIIVYSPTTKNGSVILPFHPHHHCSYKMQPINKGFWIHPWTIRGLLLSYTWKHKGRIMMIYDISWIIGGSMTLVITPITMLSRFRVNGICLLGWYIFINPVYIFSDVTGNPVNIEVPAASEYFTNGLTGVTSLTLRILDQTNQSDSDILELGHIWKCPKFGTGKKNVREFREN